MPISRVVLRAIISVTFAFGVVITVLTYHVHAEKRSKIVSSTCPYSCQNFGLKADKCRSWKSGSRCYVEIIQEVKEQKSGNTPTPKAKSSATPQVKTLELQNSRLSKAQVAKLKAAKAADECRKIHPRYMSVPNISFSSVKDAGYSNQGRYRIRGVIRGSCIAEAGYYEESELVTSLPVETSNHPGSYRFNFMFRADSKPEIRIYPLEGPRTIVRLNDVAKKLKK